jgi:replicative DNA helicase
MTSTEPRSRAARGRLRPVPDPDRQPPHNLEAEEAVLGAVLAAGRLLAEVAALLEEADFYRPAHRAIWRAVLRLADRGQPTDPVTVLGELDDSGELADIGGAPFLHTLVQAVPTVANAATTPSWSPRRPAAGG